MVVPKNAIKINKEHPLQGREKLWQSCHNFIRMINLLVQNYLLMQYFFPDFFFIPGYHVIKNRVTDTGINICLRVLTSAFGKYFARLEAA